MSHHDELGELRARIEQLEARLAQTESPLPNHTARPTSSQLSLVEPAGGVQMAARPDAEPGESSSPPLRRPITRRAAMHTALVAAAGVVVANQLAARPAEADSGDPVLLGSLNSTSNPTYLQPKGDYNSGVPVLSVCEDFVNVQGPAGEPLNAMIVGEVSGSGPHNIALMGWASNGGYGVVATGGSAGVLSTALDTSGIGVYGSNLTGTGYGVVGRSLKSESPTDFGNGFGVVGESDGGVGVQGNATTGSGVAGTSYSGYGVSAQSTTGDAVHAEITNPNSSSSGVWGSTAGKAAGVWGDLSGPGYAGVLGRTLSSGAGIYGQAWTGTGSGVHAEVIPINSKAPALSAHHYGQGAAVFAQSDQARGVVAIGKSAQLRLMPSSSKAPPRSHAEVGDFFVDASGRLWYCSSVKPKIVWHRIV